jgi:hypothetical protein
MRTSKKRIASLFVIILTVSFLTGCANTEPELTAPKFEIPAEPKSFEDMLENPNSVVYWAWKKSADQIIKNTTSKAEFTIEVGPKSIADNTNPAGGINLASRLYLDFEKQIPTKFVYFERKDVDWAQAQVNKFYGPAIQDWQKREASRMCPSEDQCRGASAMTSFDKKSALVILSSSKWGKQTKNNTDGPIEAHEYTHIIQDSQQGKYLGNLPRWQFEGEATFAQNAAIYFDDYEKYLEARESVIGTLVYTVKPDVEWLTEFISPKGGYTYGGAAWDKYDGARVYDVGMAITEVLTALAGPSSTMQLSQLVGEGLSYETAFTRIYGVEWDKGVSMIAQILAKEFNP